MGFSPRLSTEPSMSRSDIGTQHQERAQCAVGSTVATRHAILPDGPWAEAEWRLLKAQNLVVSALPRFG